MSINVLSPGETSVYLESPREIRLQDPLYKAAQELVEIYAYGGQLLDLGCSDGVATDGLANQVIGIDLNIHDVPRDRPGHASIVADMRKLPFGEAQLRNVSAVLALEVLEHETWDDSVQVMRSLKRYIDSQHVLIASMPIISPLSIATWYEGGRSLIHGRPTKGLFDRTHKILTGRRGHHRLFAAGGYQVIDEWQTSQLQPSGMTGRWAFWPQEQAPQSEFRQYARQRFARLGRLPMHTATELAVVAHHLYRHVPVAKRAIDTVFSYQGLYLLRPDGSEN